MRHALRQIQLPLVIQRFSSSKKDDNSTNRRLVLMSNQGSGRVIVAEEDRIAKLEKDLKTLESQTNFRLVLVALGALIATLLACGALLT